MSNEVIEKYFRKQINRFFKILPMWEVDEPSLPIYIRSLQTELLGCRSYVMEDNPLILSLLSILQFLLDNPTTKQEEVKREVFRAIKICETISEQASKY